MIHKICELMVPGINRELMGSAKEIIISLASGSSGRLLIKPKSIKDAIR
jgi:hypothetical protein